MEYILTLLFSLFWSLMPAFIVLSIVLLMFRSTKKKQNEALERQKEMLDVLKEIRDLLKK